MIQKQHLKLVFVNHHQAYKLKIMLILFLLMKYNVKVMRQIYLNAGLYIVL